jgi:hypothetical protein
MPGLRVSLRLQKPLQETPQLCIENVFDGDHRVRNGSLTWLTTNVSGKDMEGESV